MQTATRSILFNAWFSRLLGIAAIAVLLAAMPGSAYAACVGGAPNGAKQAGEECDDNDSDNSDFCTDQCLFNVCGDGHKCTDASCASLGNGIEGCDDGDHDDNDACPDGASGLCQPATCGDGATYNTGAGTEECDDAGDSATCDADCTAAVCGDGTTNAAAGEGCDDGDGKDNDSCPDGASGLCQPAACGDGVKWSTDGGSEACDTSGESASCDDDCTAVACGDGNTNEAAGEGCDDGDSNDNDNCPDGVSGLCQPATCGDGVLQTLEGGDEECDAGTSTCTDGFDSGSDCTTDADCRGTCDGSGSSPIGSVCTAATEFVDCGGGNCIASSGCAGGNLDDTANACRSDCSLPSCGDGIKDAGEQCDGDNAGTPGETASCDEDCTFASCGDGTTNTSKGEDCDDAGASATCDADCTNVECGDGVKNALAGEGCDDGDHNDHDACPDGESGLCQPATCGDGAVWNEGAGTEECDDAGDSATCDADCTAAECGDGTVNAAAGEGCDDGDGKDHDSCPDGASGLCQPATCGDGVKWSTDGGSEECDDGDSSNNDECLNTCKNATCGDEIVCSEPGCTTGPGGGVEACDDGNLLNTDGCLTTCVGSKCGDGILQLAEGEECDDGAATCVGGANPGDLCGADPLGSCFGTCNSLSVSEGALCTAATELLVCGVAGTCGVGDGTAIGVCDATANRDDVTDACRTTCFLPSCGDGTTDTGEQCDDANSIDTDICLSTCEDATCGDGFVCSDEDCTSGPGGGVEECDDEKDGDNNDLCRQNCAINVCGDGHACTDEDCTEPEECDDGGANSDTLANACRTTCLLPACGDGVKDTGEQCDDGTLSDTDGCLDGASGLCKKAACGDGFTCSDGGDTCKSGPTGGDEACDDGNTLDGDLCNSSCKVEMCGDGIVDIAIGEDCDGDGAGTGGETATCDLDCTFADCGDGTTNATRGEECDDGNMDSLDGCDIACQDEYCGDGIEQPLLGEECDDGVLNDDDAVDACRTTCKLASCGDGVIDTGETCDDNGESADCDADCTAVSCGDGTTNTSSGEECDDGVGNDDATPDACRTTCLDPVCGDTIVDSGHGEPCDAGPSGDLSCTADCCATGAASESYVTGFGGCQCQIDSMNGECDVDVCKRTKSIQRKLDKFQRLLDKAISDVEDRGRTDRAARRIGRNIRVLDRTQSRLARYCGNDEADATRDCLSEQMNSLRQVEAELVSNLLSNNP